MREPDIAKLNFVAGRPYRICRIPLHWVPRRFMARIVNACALSSVKSPVFVVRPSRKRPVNWWIRGMMAHFENVSTVQLDDGRLAILTWRATI